MNPAYLIPVQSVGKIIVLAIVAYSAYVILRLRILLPISKTSDGDDALSAENQESYVGRARKLLSAISHLEHADWKTVLSTLHEQELAKLNFARSAPNTLLLMGLLGTVLGLAETVGSLVKPLSNALNNASQQEVLRLLSSTLQQMGTAFSCTLWGILGALCVSGVLHFATGRLLSLLSRWDTYIIESVLPQILPESQAAQIQSLQELINQSQQIVAESRKFLAKIAPVMREAAEQFEKVLTTAGNAMQQSVEKLTQTAQAMQEKLEHVAQGVTQSAAALEDSSRELQVSTAALAEYHTDLRNAHQELLRVFEQARSDLENQIKGQLEKIGALDENFRRNAQDIVARIHDAGRQFGEATQAFREAGDRFTSEGMQIHSQIATYHQNLTEYVENLLKDHRFAIDEVEKSVAAIRDSLRAIKDSPVWQSRNGEGYEVAWNELRDTLSGLKCVLEQINGGFARAPEQQKVPNIPEEVLVRGEIPAPPFPDGTIKDTRPLTTGSPMSANDNQTATQLAEEVENLSKAIDELRNSISRDVQITQSVPGILELRQSVDSLRATTDSLCRAVAELSSSLKTLQPQPPKPRRWFSWLLIWRRWQR